MSPAAPAREAVDAPVLLYRRRPGLARGRITGKLLAPVTLFLTAVALTACGTGSTTSGSAAGASPGVVQVVAGENFWGDITRQIGGSHAKVTSIIKDPNTDPHEYETDPEDAAAIGSAAFVVLNGAGYDDFATKLLAASPKKGRTVLTVATIVGVSGDDPNPHLWYDPTYVRQATDAITKALTRADPKDGGAFDANEKAFLAAYQPYIDTLATIKAKYAGEKISYTERVPGYLVQATGLKLGTPAGFSQAVEDGNDPSAGDTAAFDAAITSKAVKVLLYNGQVTDPQTTQIKKLATSSGVPIVGVTETLPPADHDFQTWQTDQAKAVLTALGG